MSAKADDQSGDFQFYLSSIKMQDCRRRYVEYRYMGKNIKEVLYMENTICYTIEPPEKFKQLLTLYESLGWNSLGLTVNDLKQMCNQSWYAIYAFDKQQLVGMGRIISDGVVTGIICGVGVLPKYQSKGIGKEILNRIIQHCEQNRIIPQLMCEENLGSYYESLGFKKFSIGMSRNLKR